MNPAIILLRARRAHAIEKIALLGAEQQQLNETLQKIAQEIDLCKRQAHSYADAIDRLGGAIDPPPQRAVSVRLVPRIDADPRSDNGEIPTR